jgi:hypothetical protein
MEREHGPIRASRLGLLGRVVLLEFPLDTWVVLGTLLHGDLLLVLADGQTVFAAAVLHETGLWAKRCVNIFDLSLFDLTSKHTSASYSQY